MPRTLITLVLLAATPLGAEELDRVAIAVGRQIVTLSAVRRQLRMDALLEGQAVEDTPAARRTSAERLLDQALIRGEIELGRYSGPIMAEAEAAIEAYLKERKLTAAELPALVARYGFSEDDFRREVLWRLTVARFIDFRFAPGVQINDDEIAAYYQGEFLPALTQQAGAKPPRLDEVRDRIVRVLSVRKTNAAVDEWLKQTRAQAKVRTFEEAFR